MDNRKIYEFFVYSCIGVSYDDEPRIVISRIIDRAYRDAASHVLTGMTKNERKTNRDAASKEIYKAVCNSIENYDKWHEKLCKRLQNCYAHVSSFSYGIAQKWVNMTVKYLYCYYIVSDNSKFNIAVDSLLQHIKSFHAPIDGYILEKLKDPDKWSKDISNPKIYNEKRKLIISQKNDSDSELDWEIDNWVNEASKRRKMDFYDET